MLKTYQGTKIVQAEPMNELVAVENGWCRPNEDNHEWREGYHVVYPDGYHSWSPKDVFEASYQLAETHIDRMRIEYAELTEKIQKLDKFIYEHPTFRELSKDEQSLLYKQQMGMRTYATALYERIAYIDCVSPTVPENSPEEGQCYKPADVPEEGQCCEKCCTSKE